MSKSSERIAAELGKLGYRTKSFTAPPQQGCGDGVRFTYRIEDGSRAGESVTFAVAMRENEGVWPEVAPHWIYLAPPDIDLAELVRESNGAVDIYTDADGLDWMAISAPPSDFWDQIDTPDGKNMQIYLDKHIRRIWRMR